MELIYITQEIYKERADKKSFQFWKGKVLYDGENYYTVTVYKNKVEGKEQESDLKLIQGKNVGKSNYIPPKEQAISEINSRFNKKIDSGYVVVGEDKPSYIYPMLAKKFEEKRVKYPCFVQPKLDGCRAIYFPSERKFRSRKQKQFENLDHLVKDLTDIKYPLDGELILPQEYSFQDTISAIKRKNSKTPLLEFHVYDIIDESSNYEERLKKIKFLISNLSFKATHINRNDRVKVKVVKTLKANNLDDIRGFHLLHKNQGYEGSIIRNNDYPYEENKRSSSLLKLKDVMSDEFKIVDIKYDNRGAVYFVCKKNATNAKNPTFEVCPTGSLLYRKNQNFQKEIGKLATINYYDFTDDFAPKFANVVAIRDYE